MDLNECDLELYYSADFELLGKLETQELKPGGQSILVTEDNKEEYIEYINISILASQ